MEIKLTKGFFIEPDEFQFVLVHRYKTKNKDGIEREQVKKTFHRTLGQAIEKYLHMLQNDLSPDKAVTLREYVKMVTQENKRAVKAIKSLVEGKE